MEMNESSTPETVFDVLTSGRWLHGAAADFPEVTAALMRSADICHELNALRPSMSDERMALLRSLIGSMGVNTVINSPFRCDFGFNIHIGDNFIGNFNLTILDEAPVRIGHNVFIGPNCTIATITHALDAAPRTEGILAAHPVTIGCNVWLASNVTVLPGVTIGDGTVIGAGSVVTRSLPPGVLAVGNPCRILRPITDADRIAPEEIAI